MRESSRIALGDWSRSAGGSTRAAGCWARAATSASFSSASRCGLRSRPAVSQGRAHRRSASSRSTKLRSRSPKRPSAGRRRRRACTSRSRASGRRGVLHTHSIWSTVLSDRYAAHAGFDDRRLRDAEGSRGRHDATNIASGFRSSRTIRTWHGWPAKVRAIADRASRLRMRSSFAVTGCTLGARRCRRPSGTWRLSSSCSRPSAERSEARIMAIVKIPAENTTLTRGRGVRSFLARSRHRLRTVDAGASPSARTHRPRRCWRLRRRDRDAQGTRRLSHRRRDRRQARTPNLDAMLAKFSREHWHDEDEVRFIVEGRGLFHVHPQNGPVFAIEVDGRRSHPRAARHAPLVRSLRRPPHPGHSAVPGHVGLDAALHRYRHRQGLPAALLRSVVSADAADRRECSVSCQGRMSGRSCWTSKAPRRRLRSSTTCCSRTSGRICANTSKATHVNRTISVFSRASVRIPTRTSSQASTCLPGWTDRHPRNWRRLPVIRNG